MQPENTLSNILIFLANLPQINFSPLINRSLIYLLGQELVVETLNIHDFHDQTILKKQIVDINESMSYFNEEVSSLFD